MPHTAEGLKPYVCMSSVSESVRLCKPLTPATSALSKKGIRPQGEGIRNCPHDNSSLSHPTRSAWLYSCAPAVCVPTILVNNLTFYTSGFTQMFSPLYRFVCVFYCFQYYLLTKVARSFRCWFSFGFLIMNDFEFNLHVRLSKPFPLEITIAGNDPSALLDCATNLIPKSNG